KNLTAEIPHGTRVLVFGSNEAARIALFRATAGIWSAGTGTLLRPPLDAIFFLPQRPYLPPGTLRDLLIRTGQAHRRSTQGLPNSQSPAPLCRGVRFSELD